jgi:Tol biopolymer transport system component
MNHDHSLEREVTEAFFEAAPSREPDRLFDSIMRSTGRMRPRPRWLALLEEPPMRYRSQLSAGSPTLRLTTLLAATLILLVALAGAAIAGASLLRSPDVHTQVRNGLIAYDSDGAIVVAEPDGSNMRSMGRDASRPPSPTDMSPMFSPDGRWIAFWGRSRYLSDSTWHLNVTPVAGGKTRFMGGRFSNELWSQGRFPLPTIAWSPDSRRLAYSAEERVFVVELDGTYPDDEDLADGWQETELIGDPDRLATDPDWSPEGTRIAFRSDDGVYVMDADGTDVHKVSRAAGNEFAFMRPRWQPSGDLIVYYAGDPSAPGGEHDIYVAAADGTSELQVSTDAADEFYPVWSPDGSRLAFQRLADGTNATIVVVDPDGGNEVVSPALPLDGAPPIWAPDGQSLLAFTASSGAGRYGLVRLAAADGRQESSLDITNSVGDASWQRLTP